MTFGEVRQNGVVDQIGSTPAAFASLADLIRMKLAAARPKDIEDLRVLRRLAGDSPPAGEPSPGA